MSIIYLVICCSFDGECSYEKFVKGFTDKDKAIEFKTKCELELERIRKEIKEHWDKNQVEFDSLRETIREDLIAGTSSQEDEKRKRVTELVNKEREISTSSKYDSSMDSSDDTTYFISELDIEYTPTRELICELCENFALSELKNGEHPNDIEFEIIDKIANSIDQYGTDDDGNRVDFKDSVYYKEHKGET